MVSKIGDNVIEISVQLSLCTRCITVCGTEKIRGDRGGRDGRWDNWSLQLDWRSMDLMLDLMDAHLGNIN